MYNSFGLNAFICSLHRFVEQVEADCVAEDGEESVESEDERYGDKESVPEPQHQVDFPIDDVLKKEMWRAKDSGKKYLSEFTESIVILSTSGSTNVRHVAGNLS